MKLSDFLCLATLVLVVSSAHAATTIFSHTFDEGTGGLDGTAVDGGTGSPQNWESFSGVNANGAFNGITGTPNAGSATLAFTPSNGFEYILDARILNVTGDGSWVALGFANGQSSVASTNNRFITGTNTDPGVVGTAWSLFRGDNSTNPNVAQNGTGALGLGNGGIADPANWTDLNFQDGTTPGSIDMRILLDTTGGSGNWEVTWLAKLTTDTDYTVVRGWLPTDEITAATEANYTSVGFAFSSNGVDGTLQSFSLTQIPEPSAALLGGLGMMALLRRRR